jgi:retron-type reverse transcriptase
MKRVGGLFDQVVSFENLRRAAYKALRGKRDKGRVGKFYYNLENELVVLQEELVSGAYRPRPYHVFEIREPKVRKICASDFRDRVVHHALCNLLEPIFERRLIYDSYACRVGKGSHRALARVQYFARTYGYFLKCDVRKYFESIDHIILKDLLRRILKDQRILTLIDVIIDHPIPGNESGKGVSIGNLTSQHFANLVLGELDHFLKEEVKVRGYLRYMDDLICFSDQKVDLRRVLDEVRGFLLRKLRLELKDSATRIAPVTEGVPFLGFRIFRNLIRLQRSNLVRFRRKIRKKEAAYLSGQIDEDSFLSSMNSLA